MEDFQKRARRQRIRAFALRVSPKAAAGDLGYSRGHLTQVINGRIESEPALEAFTEYLDRIKLLNDLDVDEEELALV